MQSIKLYFQKLLSFLRIRASAAGLEVSDQVLRFVYSDRGKWKTEAVRLAPDVLEKGAIKDAPAFAAALQELRSHLPSAKKKRKKMNVVVSLSSVNMYSQVFTLPLMEGEDLDKAINLNVQMVSPVDISQVYYGWQFLGRDEVSLRSEIAVAFADKKIVDAMTEALYAAGFITVCAESRALALVRNLREKGTGMDLNGSYLLLDIDNSGIDFLIVRKRLLYFEYTNQWTDLADEKGQISVAKFEEMLAASLRQVVNFYTQHWPEPLAGIILSAVAFQEEALHAVKESVPLPILFLSVLSMDEPIPPEWFVAVGCALRGSDANLKDKEINLSGEEALNTFHEEQLLNFMNLWRVLVPAILGFLIVVLFLADGFLNTVRSGIESQAAFTQQGEESSEVAALEASSTAFNQSVALVAGAEAEISGNYLMIGDINNTAAANGVTVSHISFQAANTPILVAGIAQSTEQIVAFKNAIQSDRHFGTVTLPLLGIQQDPQGGYSFSVTFPLSSAF